MVNKKISIWSILISVCLSINLNSLALDLCDIYPVAPCLRQLFSDLYCEYANKTNFELALRQNDLERVKSFIAEGKIKINREIVCDVIFTCNKEIKTYFLQNFSNEIKGFYNNLQNKNGKGFIRFVDVKLITEKL